MRKVLLLFVVLLLSSCMLRPVYVPPSAYSLTSALRLAQNGYALIFLEEIDGYGPIAKKGLVASYIRGDSSYLLYGFKFLGESPKDYWKKVAKQYGTWNSRTYIDLPNSGLYSVAKEGKYVVAWWRDVWLFVVESSSNAEKFANELMDVFARIGGASRW